MPLFSVVIPTYSNCDTIAWAIKSVQQQTLQDFEIIVVGDGAPERTNEIMAQQCAEDSRIRFFENPKGEGNGERHRHNALQKARGKYIAYLGDDDLWHKSHLEVIAPHLETVDFLHTVHLCIYPGAMPIPFQGNLEDTFLRRAMMKEKYNFFGPTSVAHTLEAYNRLPIGWQPKPKGMWSDLHMWRQWFAQENMRFKSVPQITTIHLDSNARDAEDPVVRALESEKWYLKIQDDESFEKLKEVALNNLLLDASRKRYAAYHNRSQMQLITNLAMEGKDVLVTKANRTVTLRPVDD